jgi:hypothetical protein
LGWVGPGSKAEGRAAWPDGADGATRGLAFVKAEIVEDDYVSCFERGDGFIFDIGQKTRPVDWTAKTARRVDAVAAQGGPRRSGSSNGRTGFLRLIAGPRAQAPKPRSEAMSVLVQVSSMKTGRFGSILA